MWSNFPSLIRAALMAAVLFHGPELAAQAALSVTARQDLDFGSLIPGVPVTINTSDRGGSGQFEIRGQRDAEVEVELTLPAELVSQSGATLPVSFGANDGAFSQNASMRNAQSFDPRVPLVAMLGRSGRLYVFLGGTVTPGIPQAPGPYLAPVTLSVAYTGI